EPVGVNELDQVKLGKPLERHGLEQADRFQVLEVLCDAGLRLKRQAGRDGVERCESVDRLQQRLIALRQPRGARATYSQSLLAQAEDGFALRHRCGSAG